MSDSEIDDLLERAADGDQDAIGELFERFRERLQRIVQFRIDRRLKGRIDAADVIQESYLEATTRLSDYLADPVMPFFLWLRFITVQKIIALHRHHLGVKARDAEREVSLQPAVVPGATSADLAIQLLGKHTSPSQAAMRAEIKMRLEQALNEMEEIDREVLALRHFEQLSNVETAKVLGIGRSAASNRYVRAVDRLKSILERTM